MIKIIILLNVLAFSTASFSQSNATTVSNASNGNNKFIQFIFTNLDTREKAVELDQFLRNQPGVMMSRCDVVSKKFFLIYYPGYSINLSVVDSWMQQKNMTYKCVHEGVHGIDQVLDLKTTCDQ